MWMIVGRVISSLANLLVLTIIVDVVLTYILSPYHPVRAFLDRLIEPLLAPIRRVVPPVGMFDFSPLILIVLVQIVSYLLVSFFSSL